MHGTHEQHVPTTCSLSACKVTFYVYLIPFHTSSPMRIRLLKANTNARECMYYDHKWNIGIEQKRSTFFLFKR